MRELLIDFSSSPFLIAGIRAGQKPEVAASVDDEFLVSASRVAAAIAPTSPSSEPQIIPALRKNFPAIQNPELRGLCWDAIFDQLAPHFQEIGQNGTSSDLKVNAIFPQTWRAIEAAEFRAALKRRDVLSGHIASETACLAVLIGEELCQLKQASTPDPLNVAVIVCEQDGSRWWSFQWFRAGAPSLLCLTDYAPAWTRDYPSASSRPDVLFVLGTPGTDGSDLPNVTSSYTVERAYEFPLLEAGSMMLQCVSGFLQPAANLRVEMAPSLAWRWGQRSHITMLPSSALLNSSSFPLVVEKECSYIGRRDEWDSIAFCLEAVWGKAPESWSPLASVQLSAGLLRQWKRREGQRSIKLTLQMPTPSDGKISLEIIETDGPMFHDCSKFELGSALA